MLVNFAIRVVLMILVLMVIVPPATGGAVAVRKGGMFWGAIILFVQALLNSALWFTFAILTVGGIWIANFLLFGLVGLLINGLAFVLASKLMPRHFYVKNYSSAIWAAVVITVFSYLVHSFTM